MPAAIASYPPMQKKYLANTRQLQMDLLTLGIDSGEADGIFGSATRKAISHFHREHSVSLTGTWTWYLTAIRQAASMASR